MADEEQAVYEQYPAFKDVKGVRKIYLNYFSYWLKLLLK